jgi:hypothetical protein
VDEGKFLLEECVKLFNKKLTKACYQVFMWYVGEAEYGAALRNPYVAVRVVYHMTPELWKCHTPSLIGFGMTIRGAGYAIQDHKVAQKEFTRKPPTLATHSASVSNLIGILQGTLVFQSYGHLPCDPSIWIQISKGMKKLMPEEWYKSKASLEG